VNSFEFSRRNLGEVNMKKSIILSAVAVAGLTARAACAGTLDDVQERGKLN